MFHMDIDERPTEPGSIDWKARAEAAEAREASLRMQYEASQGALSDLLTEHRQDADALQRGLAQAEAIEPHGSPEWVESGRAMQATVLNTIRAALTAKPSADA